MPEQALPSDVVARVERLAARYEVGPGGTKALECLLTALVEDPAAPTAVRDPARAVDDHLADALSALDLPCLRQAGHAVDIGSGAGVPGLPLAIARPEITFVLLESSSRKCAFLSGIIGRCRIANASVAYARAEQWPDGRGAFSLATARAVAPLPVLLEYAAPLLSIGGTLVAWRGRRDPAAEAAAASAAEELGMEPAGIRAVTPYPTAEHRHLHLWSKVRETPDRFPRRAGMALKRPLGARSTASDRSRR